MRRAGWRKRSRRRLDLPLTPAERAAAGLLLFFLSRAGISVPPGILSAPASEPATPEPQHHVRDLGAAEVVE